MTIRTTTKSITNKNKWKQKKTRIYHAYAYYARYSKILRINPHDYMSGFTILVPGLGIYLEHPNLNNGKVRYNSLHPKVGPGTNNASYNKIDTYRKQFVLMPHERDCKDSIHIATKLFDELVYQYDEFEYSKDYRK